MSTTNDSAPPSPLATPRPWELVAGDYAAEVMPGFARYAACAIELARLPPHADVVDVACGPGTLALQVAPRVNRVAAIDFAPPMIEHLRGHVGYAQLGNIDARVGDGQALPYADGEFDAGFSMFGLIFFPDRAQGLRELRRVVKPGGRVVISSWLPLDNVPALDAVFGAMRDLAAPPPGAAAGPPPPPFKPALADEASIREEFAAAGLGDIEVHQVTFDLDYASSEELWKSIERTFAPIALMREKLGPAWPGAAAKLHAALVAAVGTGPQKITMPAWLSVGVV